MRRWGSDRVPPRARGGTGDQEGNGKMRMGRNKKADAIQLQGREETDERGARRGKGHTGLKVWKKMGVCSGTQVWWGGD